MEWRTSLEFLDPDLLGWIHPHDYAPGDPLNCFNLPTPPAGGWEKYDNFARNGLSLGDDSTYKMVSAARKAAGLKTPEVIVVDKEKIWINPADTVARAKYGKDYSAPRVPPNCKWS